MLSPPAICPPETSNELRDRLRVDDNSLDLYRYTFSPEFDRLAFMGMNDQVGPLFPVLELQARWIAYTWSGLVQPVAGDAMREAIRQFQPARKIRVKTFMHQMAVGFSREIGTEPDLSAHPELTRAAMFGPLASISFRISGPDPLPQAAERFIEEARQFGSVPTAELSPQQKEQLRALSQAKRGRDCCVTGSGEALFSKLQSQKRFFTKNEQRRTIYAGCPECAPSPPYLRSRF